MSRSGVNAPKNAATGILAVCRGWEVEPDATSLRTVAAAKEWATKFDPSLKVFAMVLGSAVNADKMLGQVGAEKVFYCPDADVSQPIQTIAQTANHIIMAQAVLMQIIDWVFITKEGPLASLAPLLAGSLKGQLISSCRALEKDTEGRCKAWRLLHQGRLQQEIDIHSSGARVISWDADALPAANFLENSNEASVVEVALISPPYTDAICSEEVIKGDPRTLPLVEADTILAVGRGVPPEGMAIVEKMADQFGASLGATRPVVDQDMLPYERQIGQTGVCISPRLLITFGISGASEFTVGIDGSRTVIAVNTDPQARIFQMADLGLIGDWESIMGEVLMLLDEPTGGKHDRGLGE